MSKRNGFTLLELLVVIAIIIMLVALLAPDLRGMRQVAMTVKCANNLKRIGEAAHGRLNKGTQRAEVLSAYTWAQQISEYLGGDECLICPESGKRAGDTAPRRPISDFITLNASIVFDIKETPKMFKVSDAQYRALGVGECTGIQPPPYDDDGSGIVWWGWEDGGDMDYQDALLKVTERSDGMSEVFCWGCTAGRPWINYVPGFRGGGVAVSDGEMNSYYGGVGKTLILPTGGAGASSYAMNAAAVDLRGKGRILALDYVWTIARSDRDDWSDDADFDTDNDGVLDFARHRGRLNVLLIDGSVQLKRPEEIDPADVNIENTLWLP